MGIPDQSQSLVRHPLTVDAPPHWRARETAGRIYLATILAAAPAMAAGLAFFGWHALRVLTLSVASTLLAEEMFRLAARRPWLTPAARGDRIHAVLIGLLLGMTLPATVSWPVVALAGGVAAVLGKGLFGGLGHYLWHPVLVGRLAAQLLFFDQVVPRQWPLLARGHVFLGQLSNASSVPIYSSWLDAVAPGSAEAFRMADPLAAFGDMVRHHAGWVQQAIEQVTTGAELGSPAGAVLFRMLWDRLPSMMDVVIGAVGGGVGATSAAALVIGGLVLIHQGCLRWQMVVAFLLAAAATAVVAPLRIGGLDPLNPSWHWWPGLQFHKALPVGPAYVAYHLMAGDLLLGMFFIGADSTSRPITARGQILFGLGCGMLTVLIRLYVIQSGSAYLAILAMNGLRPLIDRFTQPRVFGR